MEVKYQFGYPINKRILMIADALDNPITFETQYEEYRGKYRPLKIVEVPIELLVYRIENIRTKSLQKQWLVTHPECEKNFFSVDSESIEVQEAQHQILQSLANKEGLLNAFKNGNLQQKEALIATDEGVVVNGNRRLCVWRTLYYSDRIKYNHFQTVRVAILPDHDPQGVYDLEVALQIHSDMKAEYTWHSIAADYKEKVESGVDITKFAQKQGKNVEVINRLIECYEYAEEYLEATGHKDEWSLVDKQPIYVRTTKGQLKIPEVKHIVKTVKMSRLQREIYMTLKSEIKRQMNPMLSDSSRYELRRIGKCVMKVMEFVSNPALLSSDMNYVFDKRIGSLLVATDGPKIEYVCRRARELAKEKRKVIIWSCFVQNVELIALRLKDLGAEYIHGGVDAGNENDQDTREGKIKRFHSDPKCMVLVANPAACSEGISLHRICQYAIYLDRSFNAAHYLQSEDRIHRLGLSSDARPTVEFVECEDSIDQVVRERLTLKVAIMASALNDSSLKVEPDIYEEDEEDESDMDNIANDLSVDDARAVIDYFFDGDSDA